MVNGMKNDIEAILYLFKFPSTKTIDKCIHVINYINESSRAKTQK